MSKQFFIKESRKIIEECAQISEKNRIDRETFLAGQTSFKKRFADTQSHIQTLRESIQKTMR